MSISFGLNRRWFLQAGVASTLAASVPAWAVPDDTPQAIAQEAYIWGYPLVSFGRYLDAYTQQGNPLNQFLVQAALSTPSTPGGGPNVDTLYGYSWLDLRAGPQVLHVPDVGDRYYSIQLIDMYSNVFAYVGRRATGTKAGAYAIVGPHWKGQLPAGVTAIRAPTVDVIAFTRTAVMDDADLRAARDIQAQFAFGDLGDYPRAARPPILKQQVPLPPILDLSTGGSGFYDELCARIAADPPPAGDRDALKRFARIGIGPGHHPTASIDGRVKAALAAAVPIADKQVKTAQYGKLVNGWYVNYGIVAFPTDPLQRASTVIYGPGAHIAAEGLYFNMGKGPDGQSLSGAKNYVLRFPKGGLPPVDGFWSLTVYNPTMSLVENPIGRYAIKDRTPGLAYGADGSLELQIQHAPPAQGNANWLPAPAGPFRLVMRTYQPNPEILNQAYQLPPVVIVAT